MSYPKIRTPWSDDFQKAPYPLLDTSRLACLTPQELQVFTLLACGLKIEEVAPLMHRQNGDKERTVSPERVKDYLRGIYSKLGISSREQVTAMAAASGHLKLASGQPLADLIEAYSPLPPRTRDVLPYAALGYTNAETATILGISHHTIADHIKTIYKQLGLNNSVDLTAAYLAMQQEAQKPSPFMPGDEHLPREEIQPTQPISCEPSQSAESEAPQPEAPNATKKRWIPDIELRRLRREKEMNLMGHNIW